MVGFGHLLGGCVDDDARDVDDRDGNTGQNVALVMS